MRFVLREFLLFLLRDLLTGLHKKDKLDFIQSGMSTDLERYRDRVPTELDRAIVRLKRGHDVEVYVKLVSGGRMVKHALTIYEALKYEDGTYRLTVVDDPHQGDGKAENRSRDFFVDAEGYIRFSEGGRRVGCLTRVAWDLCLPNRLKPRGVPKR